MPFLPPNQPRQSTEGITRWWASWRKPLTSSRVQAPPANSRYRIVGAWFNNFKFACEWRIGRRGKWMRSNYTVCSYGFCLFLTNFLTTCSTRHYVSHETIFNNSKQSYLLLLVFHQFFWPSPSHSFIPGLKPSFSANHFHCSLSISSSGLTTWIP